MSTEMEEYLTSLYVPPAPVPPITIDELMTSIQVITKKEADDKILLDSISALSSDFIRDKLISWALAGFPNVYEIYRVSITVPAKCSDGIERNLDEYITFCSGKTIQTHVAGVQEKVSGINVSFANMGTYISIVVSKP